ncbi:unnamed protein product [Orchesella dallaii]|uniref:Uncharacterized protein n=1 Tax=Orchesella dallaii TaxID=48710 RepID=A0ABP1RAP9_9HEXA
MAIMETESRENSREVVGLFQNFEHCLFQFHIGNSVDQIDNWDSYTNIINFYAGVAPFTFQNSINYIPTHGENGERWGALRKFSNCSVYLQLHLCQPLSVFSGTLRWKHDFIWFMFLSNITDCDDSENESSTREYNLHTAMLARFASTGIFFGIFNYSRVSMLCLSCEQTNWMTNLKEDYIDIPSYKSLCFIALIFSTLFKGTLVSFLSNPQPPKVPDCLPLILEANMVIATQGSFTMLSNTRKFMRRSVLKDTLMDILVNLPEYNESVYGDLYRKMKWIGDGYESTTIELLKGNMIFNKYSNESTDLGKGFFIMDRLDGVELFKLHLSFFTGNWVSNTQPLPIFMSRVGWAIKKNYLYSIFRNKLAQLDESGIYNRWFTFYAKADTLHHVKGTAKILGGYGPSGLGWRNSTAGNSVDQVDNWDAYTNIINFYAGVAPFTFQDSINYIPTHGQNGERWGSLRKFSNCSVYLQLHLCQPLSAFSGTLRWKHNFIWFVFLSNITDCDNEENESSTRENNLQTAMLARFGSTGIFFGIFNYSRVGMLCLSCDKKNWMTNLNDGSLSNIPSYKRLWSKLHSNLNQVHVLLEFKWKEFPNAEMWNCNIHKGGVIDAQKCTFLLMMKSLNFSMIDRESPHFTQVVQHSAIISGLVVDTRNLRWMAANRLELQGYAMDGMPYAYIMVLDSLPTNWKALIQPFDWMTWTSLIFATFFIALVLYQEFNQIQIRPSFHVLQWALKITSSFINVWLPTLTLLVDQSVLNVTILKRNSISCAIWILWSFIAFIFSTLFKGTLVSFLSNPQPPKVPDTLPLILEANMVIATQSSFTMLYNGRNLMNSSILKNTLKDLLGNLPEYNGSVYGDLYRKMKWIGDDYESTTIELLKGNMIFNKDSNESTDLGKGFFIMDRLDRVELFKLHLSFFTENWVSNTQPLPIFMSRVGWAIKKNYLYSIFRNKLAQLDESGIYIRWFTFYGKADSIHSVKETAKRLDRLGSGWRNGWTDSNINLMKNRNGISLANLFNYVYMNKRKPTTHAETLPSKVYMIMVAGTIIWLAGLSVVLGIEMLVKVRR